MNITFVIPSRNNLEFLKLAYYGLKRQNYYVSDDILVLDDASTDGTIEWLQSLEDSHLYIYRNHGPERIGIVGMFDKGIATAKTDIIMAFHADMVPSPNLASNLRNYVKRGTVVSATRVEPPLHPSGLEKITKNFGLEANEFKYDEWALWCEQEEKKNEIKITLGVFAPWCMYKDDFLNIGGHDKLFAPQSKEDSDLFNRFYLNGYQLIQPWDCLVYHFTCRGSRFNKYSGGDTGKNSNEWIETTTKNGRNFIRKWGHYIRHDEFMKPIIPHKYDIGFDAANCTYDLLVLLEPWCDRIHATYNDLDPILGKYIRNEQPNTKIDLSKKVFDKDYKVDNNIVVEFDATKLTQQSFNIIQNLPDIITDSGEIGSFELDIFKITIKSLETYEQRLITNDDTYYKSKLL